MEKRKETFDENPSKKKEREGEFFGERVRGGKSFSCCSKKRTLCFLTTVSSIPISL